MRGPRCQFQARATQAANDANDPETALSICVETSLRITGNAAAFKQPSSLKTGERHFFVGGVFLVAPDNASHLLVAEWGFPPEQHRLNFPLDTGHPGWTWKNRQPLILENTDEHSDFKQILKTSRMGSAMYAPMLWQGQFIGQIITAAQARGRRARAIAKQRVYLLLFFATQRAAAQRAAKKKKTGILQHETHFLHVKY